MVRWQDCTARSLPGAPPSAARAPPRASVVSRSPCYWAHTTPSSSALRPAMSLQSMLSSCPRCALDSPPRLSTPRRGHNNTGPAVSSDALHRLNLFRLRTIRGQYPNTCFKRPIRIRGLKDLGRSSHLVRTFFSGMLNSGLLAATPI